MRLSHLSSSLRVRGSRNAAHPKVNAFGTLVSVFCHHNLLECSNGNYDFSCTFLDTINLIREVCGL